MKKKKKKTSNNQGIKASKETIQKYQKAEKY